MSLMDIDRHSVKLIVISITDLEDAILKAARIGAEIAIRKMPKDRPSQYSIKDAANELSLHRNTVAKMIKSGDLKLNKVGKVSAEEIDRLIFAPQVRTRAGYSRSTVAS